MHKQLIYVANWKMNMLLENARRFAIQCKALVEHHKNLENTIILCPMFPNIYPLADVLALSTVYVGAQNCSEHEVGAYTGEVCAQALAEVGCSFCIVGHSERRIHFNETNEIIARKAHKLFKARINPIICIGETAQEHQAQQTLPMLQSQLQPIVEVINRHNPEAAYIAYEPVWAIGTGKIPDASTLEETFNWLSIYTQKNIPGVKKIHLLYGGSVDEHTAKTIAHVQRIDGFLIGSASLDFQKFKNIVS